MSIEGAVRATEAAAAKMTAESMRFGLVAYVGGIPEEIAASFASVFGCPLAHLPSLGTHRQYPTTVKVANLIYLHLPHAFRRPMSWIYRGFRLVNKSKLPTGYRFEPIWRADDSPVLLVDDSCLTGETLRFWKRMISENCSRPVVSFTLTATGRVKPDYYHSRKWRSFAWRPVGL